MTDKEREIYNRALNKYGIKAQQMMVVEECSELLNAIAKTARNRATREEIITELADVAIMVEQMAFFYGEDLFLLEKERKLKRLNERLKNADNGKREKQKGYPRGC